MLDGALIKSIRDKNNILFVGSGVSKPLGLPTHQELIDFLADDLGFDPEVFSLLGDFRVLAEFYYLEKKSLDALKTWVDTQWHEPTIAIKDSAIHRLIVDLDFPIIYTTNYDRWLESAFEHYGREFVKIVNAGDFPKIKNDSTQIIKFHGDFTDDTSIILTESSYFDRLDLNSPLDIKLQYDSMGKSILFIGYSLSDINVRFLLYKINKLWGKISNPSQRPKSYIFLTKPNTAQERILKSWGVHPIISDEDSPGDGTIKFLQELKNCLSE